VITECTIKGEEERKELAAAPPRSAQHAQHAEDAEHAELAGYYCTPAYQRNSGRKKIRRVGDTG